MTSLLPAPRRTRPSGEARADAAHRRPLVLLAVLAGAVAAASTLLVCLAGGVVGWFLTDAGAHGAPRDGLRVGALGWLMAHGSGVHVDGTHVTAVPLGLTLLAGRRDLAPRPAAGRLRLRARAGRRRHRRRRPRLDRRLCHGALHRRLRRRGRSSRTTSRPHRPPRRRWCGCCSGPSRSAACVGGTAIAIGSGRAAIWTSFLPLSLRAAAAAAWRTLVWFLCVSTARLRGRPAGPLGRRRQRDVAAPHQPRRSDPAGRSLGTPASERRPVHRLLPAGAGVRRRRAHPRQPDRGRARAAAVVPPARRAARHRPDSWLDGRPARRAPAARRRGRPPHPDALPDDRGGTTRRCAESEPGSPAPSPSPSSPPSREARSGRAGWPWSGRSRSRSCSTASRRSASVASSAR